MTKRERIFYLDIETAPLVYRYNDLDETRKKHWDKKATQQLHGAPEDTYQKAGIYAEFAKVLCVAYGYKSPKGFVTGVIADDNEKNVLQQLSMLLATEETNYELILCAHNGKEFDFPFLGRRYLINNLALPSSLKLQGKKPWEVKHLDTLELWKFGDYKHYVSLELLAHVFDIPSPKSDIDGSMVAKVYYEERNLPRIANYCVRDVVTLARVYARFAGIDAPSEDEIIFV